MTKRIHRYILLSAILFCAFYHASAIEFAGASQRVLEYAPVASSGLDAVYVIPSSAGVSISYDSDSPTSVRWYRFSNLGAAYAEEIPATVDGRKTTVAASRGDMGYVIEEGSARRYFWVTDYSAHALRLESLVPSVEQDCDRARFLFSGDASEIPYFGINGRRCVLSRELTAEYSTLEFDGQTFAYVQTKKEEVLPSVGPKLIIDAPLCDTQVRLSGDRFLKEWGRDESVESTMLNAVAVAAETRATQNGTAADNQQRTEGASLGGSAPCDITFEAAVSDEAVFREWQISRDPEFGITENSFSDLVFDYSFREQGRMYVRFICNNSAGTCEYAGPTYEIFIGESKLDIPNAFSPEGSPGVNDEWKVSYRSLVEYECHIFNRWGKELFSSREPSEGWDGRYGGKYVPSGVYFYVIKAKGADGVEYNRSGDINIIKYSAGQPVAE